MKAVYTENCSREEPLPVLWPRFQKHSAGHLAPNACYVVGVGYWVRGEGARPCATCTVSGAAAKL